MTDGTTAPGRRGMAAPSGGAPPWSVLGRFARAFADVPVPFEVVMPDGAVQPFGRGPPAFRVTIRNRDGVRALASLDEGRFGDAYLAGDIDIEGDMLRPFELRHAMGDFHLLTARSEEHT